LNHQNVSALRIARRLESHAAVERVWHPFLESHPQNDLARGQMRLGGTMLSVELKGGIDDCRKFLSALSLARVATSFGGPETLVCHPATSTHVGLSVEALAAMGVTESLVRFSVGLEDPEDLSAEIEAALS
ncbi:MAG: PLP-dependent transferase, partial [Actinomycetota bacterium]